MINVAVLGYGTVGSGVVEVISTNQESINKRAGQEINVKYVLDLREFPGTPIENILVHDYNIILEDPEVDIVVEVMGGLNPSYPFVKSALEAGKSVCTSNKALVAAYGPELLQIARDKNANFLFEASVGGGIPIIRPMNESLTPDEVTEITGILNGTTNYILSKMTSEGADYDSVLKQAQDLGYAERNPEADVEGHDTCRKIAILTSLACGKNVNFEEIPTEGITKITDTDIKYAKALNGSIKLLGKTDVIDGTIYSIVAPFIIGTDNPLGSVNDVLNGIFVHGNMVGDVMFYGSGAGKLPTAAAVVADIIEAARHKGTNLPILWSDEKVTLGSRDNFEGCFFVRANNSAEEVTKVFGNVSFVSVEGVASEVGFVTDKISEGTFAKKAAELDVINTIRMA